MCAGLWTRRILYLPRAVPHAGRVKGCPGQERRTFFKKKQDKTGLTARQTDSRASWQQLYYSPDTHRRGLYALYIVDGHNQGTTMMEAENEQGEEGECPGQGQRGRGMEDCIIKRARGWRRVLWAVLRPCREIKRGKFMQFVSFSNHP